MNKQELQNKINKIKEHLANMEKMLAECEYERWKPRFEDEYYCVTRYGEVIKCTNTSSVYDNETYNVYNCFETKEQAEQEAEKILVRRMLEDIARRLNKGQKIDWDNKNQSKYCICLDVINNAIVWEIRNQFISQGVVYCLDKDFSNVAKSEIGEERLKKYLRGE